MSGKDATIGAGGITIIIIITLIICALISFRKRKSITIEAKKITDSVIKTGSAIK